MHFFGAVLIPFYTQWGGLSLSQAMMLNSWFMLWNVLLEIPTGTVADYLGRKVSLALGSLFGAAAALVYVSTPDMWSSWPPKSSSRPPTPCIPERTRPWPTTA